MNVPFSCLVLMMMMMMSLGMGAVAHADEAMLETYSVAELLGERPLGLDVDGAQLWNGSLEDLAEAVTQLGLAVSFGEGVEADVSVTLVSNAAVSAVLARAAVGASCKRLGYEPATTDEGMVVSVPADWRPVDGDADLQVMITVVGEDQVASMAQMHRQLNLVGEGAVVEEVAEAGAVVVVNTDSGMGLQPDPEALFRSFLRQPAEPLPAEGVAELGAGRYRVERAVVAPFVYEALSSARVVPHYRDGELQGFKVFSIRPSSPYRALAIRNGDVFLRHDGQPIEHLDGLGAVLAAWLTAEEVEVVLLRRGEETTLHYEMVGDPLVLPELWTVGTPTREQYQARHGVIVDGDVVVLQRTYVLALRETLPEDIHWRYATDEAGEVLGMEGNPRGGNLLHLLGVRSREVLTAVDGQTITSPRELMELFTALRQRSDVVLTVDGRDGAREIVVRVEGDPDPDAESWPLPLLDVAPTLGQQRAVLGITETEGGLQVPRTTVLELLDPLSELRLSPEPVDGTEGYRLMCTDRTDRLAPLGLRIRDTVVALDDEPVVDRETAEAVFGRMLVAAEMTLTVRHRGRSDETLHYTFAGDPVLPPGDWDQLQIEPTLDERRAEAGVHQVRGRTVLPRQLILDEGWDLLRWIPEPAGDTVAGYTVPRRSRAWLNGMMGLREGDVVLAFDGRELDSGEARDAMLEGLLTARKLRLTVLRDGARLELKFFLQGEPAERPESWQRRGRPPRR